MNVTLQPILWSRVEYVWKLIYTFIRKVLIEVNTSWHSEKVDALIFLSILTTSV